MELNKPTNKARLKRRSERPNLMDLPISKSYSTWNPTWSKRKSMLSWPGPHSTRTTKVSQLQDQRFSLLKMALSISILIATALWRVSNTWVTRRNISLRWDIIRTSTGGRLWSMESWTAGRAQPKMHLTPNTPSSKSSLQLATSRVGRESSSWSLCRRKKANSNLKWSKLSRTRICFRTLSWSNWPKTLRNLWPSLTWVHQWKVLNLWSHQSKSQPTLSTNRSVWIERQQQCWRAAILTNEYIWFVDCFNKIKLIQNEMFQIFL